jgi:outer membrane biosynthesis protein TonB
MPKPAPVPKPAPAPLPKPVPAPKPAPKPAPAPISKPAPKPVVREVPFIAELDISAQAQIKAPDAKCELKETPAAKKTRSAKTKQTQDSCVCVPAMICLSKQKWRELYEAEQGFSRGTLFSELDLPFIGEGDCKRG